MWNKLETMAYKVFEAIENYQKEINLELKKKNSIDLLRVWDKDKDLFYLIKIIKINE
ncbi:MAG: hypothetical protein V1901_04155 [Patescibacteria group bacterium]